MKVIPSASDDRAAAPAGKRTIGTLQESSSKSESWLDAQVTNLGFPDCYHRTDIFHIRAVEPPTRTILEPAETAAIQRLAAISEFDLLIYQDGVSSST